MIFPLLIVLLLFISSLVHTQQQPQQQQPSTPITTGENRILVTGAAGFIGYHLIDLLLASPSKKNIVVGIDNFNDYYSVELKHMRANDLRNRLSVNIIEGDTCDEALIDELFKQYKFTHVVHLAAQAGVRYSLKNPKSYVTANIMCNVNILEAIKKWNFGTRFIYASSSSVYGLNDIPFSEKQTVDRPTNVYGSTKIAGEHLSFVYNYLHGIQVIGLRFFTVYGDDGRPDMAVFAWAESMAHNRPITLFYKTGVEITRDFTHVDDIVRGIEGVIGYSSRQIRPKHALNNKNRVTGDDENGDDTSVPKTIENTPEVFNLGNNKPESVLALVSYLATEMGKEKVEKDMVPLPDSDMVSTFADIDKAVRLFDFKPRVSLQSGIKRFVKWYKSVFWPENVIYTTYFTGKDHHKMTRKIKCSSFALISEWYHSVHKLGLRAIVFHDELDDAFIAKYTTHNVRFKKVTLGQRTNNDERFFVYLDHLQEKMKTSPELAPKRIFITDLFNVKMNESPFDSMTKSMEEEEEEELLIVGSDKIAAQTEDNQCVDVSERSELMSPSIIGASTNTMIKLLTTLTQKLSRAPVSANCNVPIFNEIVRQNPSSVMTKSLLHRVQLDE